MTLLERASVHQNADADLKRANRGELHCATRPGGQCNSKMGAYQTQEPMPTAAHTLIEVHMHTGTTYCPKATDVADVGERA